MVRNVIFRNVDTEEELTMPVPPASYDVEEGRRIETVDMAVTGQVNLPGLETLMDRTMNFLLPSSARTYCAGGWQDPWEIIARLNRWCGAGNVLRLVITGTQVNVPVLIETVRYSEQDGTNDVYLTLSLKKYRYLQAPTTELQAATDNADRPDESELTTDKTYVVQEGDSIWSICYVEYGDGVLCYRLATYNGLSGVFVRPGDVLRLPPLDVLMQTEMMYVPVDPNEQKWRTALWDQFVTDWNAFAEMERTILQPYHLGNI